MADHTMDAGLHDRIEALEALVAEQRALLEQQGTLLRQLASTTPETERAVSARAASDPPDEAALSRRAVLGKAGMAAAAATVGAVVFTSEPAAAAAGTFDGNPAVTATASPTSGKGVKADTVTGIGVEGNVTGTSGTAIRGIVTNAANASGYGVLGTHAGTGGAAVAGHTTGGAGAPGVYGTTTNGNGVGVRGRNTSAATFEDFPIGVEGSIDIAEGYGVRGVCTDTTGSFAVGVSGYVAHPTGLGVLGEAISTSGAATGVRGMANSPLGTGVAGRNMAGTGGVGVKAEVQNSSTGIGIVSSARLSQLKLTSPDPIEYPLPPPTAGVARTAGEIVFDVDANLWVCVAPGNPGTWRKLAGLGTGGAFHPLPTPTRVYDSRPNTQPAIGSKTQLAANTARAIDCTANSSGVPAGALGVLATLLVVNSTAATGNMTLWADGAPAPATNNVLWTNAGERASVLTYTSLSAAGKCQVRANQKTHVVLDIVGYYR